MFQIKELFHNYKIYKGEGEKVDEKTALSDVTFHIEKGQFVGILGANGSGKTTLALHLAALLAPSSGLVLVRGLDTSKSENILEIRKTAGIVFQNPDDQLVGVTVEEDVAFGPENLGMESSVIDQRIDQSLSAVGMGDKRYFSSHDLSGGEKQKVVIAGLLAMEPECILFDEPTAMTDPRASREIGKAIRKLNRERGITILYITHNISQVEDADYLYIMESGRLAGQGRPLDLFQDPDSMEKWGLALPGWVRLASALGIEGWPERIHSEEDLLSYLTQDQIWHKGSRIEDGEGGQEKTEDRTSDPDEKKGKNISLLELDGVSYSYDHPASRMKNQALSDICLKIDQGECIGVIGGNGAGKSTLFSLLNGLLRPASGRVCFLGQDVWAEGFSRKELRKRVGLCFQNPEHQLFADRVIDDIAFGPGNMGDSHDLAIQKARQAMQVVGLGEAYEDLSPFMLSGGEKRRVALAGILAMEPDLLVLDEPAAGLDEPGRKNLFSIIRELVEDKKITVIFSSHSMEDAVENADRILVMDRGKILLDGKPASVFSNKKTLEQIGLEVPWACDFAMKIEDKMKGKGHHHSDYGREEGEIPCRMDSLVAWCAGVEDSSAGMKDTDAGLKGRSENLKDTDAGLKDSSADMKDTGPDLKEDPRPERGFTEKKDGFSQYSQGGKAAGARQGEL